MMKAVSLGIMRHLMLYKSKTYAFVHHKDMDNFLSSTIADLELS